MPIAFATEKTVIHQSRHLSKVLHCYHSYIFDKEIKMWFIVKFI